MKTIGNIIWFCSFGWTTALIWLIGAFFFAISIIGLPLSRSAFEMAKLSAFPFGKTIVHIRDLDQKELNVVTATTGTIGFVFNIIWLLSFGWVLFLSNLVLGVIAFCTIIFIPFGLQYFKLATASLWPVGKRVVSTDVGNVISGERASKTIEKYRK